MQQRLSSLINLFQHTVGSSRDTNIAVSDGKDRDDLLGAVRANDMAMARRVIEGGASASEPVDKLVRLYLGSLLPAEPTMTQNSVIDRLSSITNFFKNPMRLGWRGTHP